MKVGNKVIYDYFSKKMLTLANLTISILCI